MRVGITGHSNITVDSVPAISEALRATLADAAKPLVGISCLARGADQLFATVVLELGGTLEVILPAADYRENKVKPANREQFETLIGKADKVHVMPFETSNREAYEAANENLLDTADVLVAVWDGAPPDGRGGTGDTVRVARERRIPVTVVWPPGARRE
ncbi:hypothetical protein ACQEVB_20775 [Pseudonocardia sp. CA-107938]|uniref:hypothetical protein n=1 Tax=Pseudonocardia sp. CA-107938 TaxID=3240021 RepID=UPI003D8A1744